MTNETAIDSGKIVPKHRSDEMQTVEEAWEFWRPIVCNDDGSLNMEQLKLELCDAANFMGFAASVYDYATGGMCTKVNTLPSVVKSLIDDHITEVCEEDQAPAPVAEPVGWISPEYFTAFSRQGFQVWTHAVPGWMPLYAAPFKPVATKCVMLPAGQKCECADGSKVCPRSVAPQAQVASQAPAVQAWQPIDTAPFNEDLLTLNNSGRIVQDYRSRQYENNWTHWMPLPAEPESDVPVQPTGDAK